MLRYPVLRHVPLFRGLDEEELKEISGKLINKQFQKDDIIVAEGEISSDFYIINSGSVVIIRGQGDDEKVLTFLDHGNFFGELSLFTEKPRTASVKSVYQSELLVMHREDFHNIMKKFPLCAINMCRILSIRQSNLTGSMDYYISGHIANEKKQQYRTFGGIVIDKCEVTAEVTNIFSNDLVKTIMDIKLKKDK